MAHLDTKDIKRILGGDTLENSLLYWERRLNGRAKIDMPAKPHAAPVQPIIRIAPDADTLAYQRAVL